MQLMRLGPVGQERPAVRLEDGEVFDLSSMTADIDGRFLADDGMARVAEALAGGRLRPLPSDGVRVGAPVARPGAVVCVGQNYAAHAAEVGGEKPSSPVMFLKHPNTVVGPYDDVLMPRGATRVDWEVELALVIGRTARYLDSPDDALSCVAGYVLSNDVTERFFQFELSGGQWSKGKCAETFNPLGPWLVPAAAIGDVQDLKLRSSVNGQPRQSSTTADMLFSVSFLVWHLSQFLVLEPGDVVNTGTPEGVAMSGRFPYLDEGDVYEGHIDGLGVQRQTFRRA
jgi:2-keto-4-pentenoate hydratase/2-oxohepta-3-ene-1,7-dioic acid hydratase in catechol pathway